MAFSRDKSDNILNEKILQKTPNKLKSLIPKAQKWADSVFVLDNEDICSNYSISVYVDVIKQEVIIYCNQ